jgi:exosortase C (VPDSG-CTERM-specific)
MFSEYSADTVRKDRPKNGVFFLAGLVVWTALFSIPLYQWVRLAFSESIHSHLVLIPFISGYLLWQRRREMPEPVQAHWPVTALCSLAALSLLGASWQWATGLTAQDEIALRMGAYLTGVLALGSACFGLRTLRQFAFPICFLVFMIPIPSGLEAWLEVVLQRLSADAAHLFFWVFGETFLRDGQVFYFEGLTIEVAQECSGIRSSLVLFIFSLVAANFLLCSRWRQAVLVAAVLPLGILRNGFRVYAITELTLHVNPEAINSPLHHRGGPLFFALSLVPFMLLLWFLRKTERRAGGQAEPLASREAAAR